MRRGRAAVVTAAALASLALSALAGCSSVDANAITTATCPPSAPDEFRLVSSVLEQRCGTIDCHGSTYRPLRFYSRYGIRRPLEQDAGGALDFKEYYPGGDVPTTDEELEDNARSICGLEPELMSSVVQKQAEPEVLSFIRKPRLLEKHKGGLIWYKGDPGDQCITNWLLGGKDISRCKDELEHP